MKTKKIYAKSSRLPYCCGVRDIGEFSRKSREGWTYGYKIDDLSESGAGFYTATFIDTAECAQAYKELCEKFDLLYQSPVRKNTSSGRLLFFCFFSNKQ